MTYTTKVASADKSSSKRRRRSRSKKKIVLADKHSAHKYIKRKKVSKGLRRKIKNVAAMLIGVTVLGGLLGGLWFFSYLQELNQELPSLSDPFKDKELASVVFDRTGNTELARFIGDFARDPVHLEDIPEHVKWSFLAAEDIDFYVHQGFDPAGIIRCGIRFLSSGGGNTCGGSTITQQVVKITVLGSEVKIERKLKEMLMAIKIEQAYSKDEILQLYLTVAPFGGNIYGITTAADFYFDKEVAELTLAQAAILASIIQNPTRLSPTKGLPDRETAQEAVKWRQEHVVLDQLRRNVNKINAQTRVNYDDEELDDVISKEMIAQALEEELIYEPPIFANRKAGHFVDYVQLQLTTENYKFGEEPFTETELLTGGYQIYTTLDWKLQKFAEQTVQDAMKTYGTPYKASNAAMMLMTPKNGEIIAMVGSKNYNGKSSGCNKKGIECAFNPQVNILNTKQSPGSSTKPFGTYEAYRKGLMHTGTFLPDIPITIPGGFSIKNWNGSYFGVSPKTYAGQMLSDSRNLPAIIVLEAIGVESFLRVMKDFGYTTYNRTSQFGHSVILGGADVIPIEHAQGYGVFANNGRLVRHEVVTKIIDRNGQVVFEAKPKKEKVADEKAVFMVNQSILNSHQISWDGRDVAAKSGTSENSTDVWMAVYSPDFVAIGWMGNNNNKEMDFNAFGVTIVQPWLKNFLRQVGETTYLKPARNFKRPDGVSRVGAPCKLNSTKCFGSYSGIAGGWGITKFDYAIDNVRSKIRVCKNQPKKLARPIDEFFDNARDGVAITYSMPYAPQWNKYLNNFMKGKNPQNGGPSKYCTADYSGSGVDGVWINESNVSDGQVLSYTPTITGNVFTTKVNATVSKVEMYFDGVLLLDGIDTSIGGNGGFSISPTISGTYDSGTYALRLKAYDTAGTVFNSNYTIVLTSVTTANMTLDATAVFPADLTLGTLSFSPTDATVDTTMLYTGPSALTNVQMCYSVSGGAFTCVAAAGGYTASMTIPHTGGNSYNLDYYYTATAGTSGIVRSNSTQISVIETP